MDKFKMYPPFVLENADNYYLKNLIFPKKIDIIKLILHVNKDTFMFLQRFCKLRWKLV